MTENVNGANSNFVNVNLNVNGKKHVIKLEKGVSLQGVSIHSSGKLVKNEVTYKEVSFDDSGEPVSGNLPKMLNNKDYHVMYSQKEVNEIKLTEAEYAMLKNIADNDNNKGTLSKEDLASGVEKFVNAQFSDDIKKDLPKGYHIERSKQDRGGYESLHAVATKNGKDESLDVAFVSEDDSNLGELLDKSADGKVYEESFGDGEFDFAYLGKDNKVHTYNQGSSYYSTAYKDKDGTLITEFSDGTKSKEYKTKDGKQIYELYDENAELERKEVRYKNAENKDVLEVHSGDYVTIYTEKRDNYPFEDLERYNALLAETYEDGKLVKREFHNANYSSGNTSWETYDKDGKVTGRGYKSGDIEYEEYDEKGNVIERNYKAQTKPYETEYYEYSNDGKLDKVKVNISYWDAGNTLKKECTFDAKHNLLEVDGFKVKEAIDSKTMSDNAKQYRSEFLNMSAKDIAQRMYDQISGPSMNQKTLDMFDGIPDEKLIDVLKEYNNIKGMFGSVQDSMFVALSDEWGLGQEELLPRMNYAYAIYLDGKKDDLQPEDIKVKDRMQQHNDDSNSFKVNLAKVEEYITGIECKYIYEYDEAPKLKD